MAKGRMEARLREDDTGVTLVEYGIGLILAISVGAVLLTQLGVGVIEQIGDSCDAIRVGVTAC
jgi:Flp pilus assembly pilin Flp